MTDAPTRVLGIDPGLNLTGYAVLEAAPRGPKVLEAGVVRGLPGRGKGEMAERLRHLYDSIGEIIDEFRPQTLAVEQLYSHYAHPRTAILMAHARGAILLAGANRGVAVNSYGATAVKRRVTGSGKAPKGQVQLAVQRELNLAELPDPPDVADALALALCDLSRGGVRA